MSDRQRPLQMSVFWKVGAAFTVGLAVVIYFWQDMPSEIHTWSKRMAGESAENRANFAGMNKSAFVLGYTGETGKALVNELANSNVFSRIVLIGRREVQYEDEARKKMEQKIVDFDKIEEHQEAFQGLDVGFCCIGTTRGKSGKAGFIKVDHDYVINTAKVAKAVGCDQFHLVSSTGANKNSWFLYPKVKGQVEEALKSLEFSRLAIYQPGLLLCDREESRPGEKAARAMMKAWNAAFPTSGSVPVTALATAMVNAAVAPGNPPSQILDNKAIHDLAGLQVQKKAEKSEKKTEKNAEKVVEKDESNTEKTKES